MKSPQAIGAIEELSPQIEKLEDLIIQQKDVLDRCVETAAANYSQSTENQLKIAEINETMKNTDKLREWADYHYENGTCPKPPQSCSFQDWILWYMNYSQESRFKTERRLADRIRELEKKHERQGWVNTFLIGTACAGWISAIILLIAG